MFPTFEDISSNFKYLQIFDVSLCVAFQTDATRRDAHFPGIRHRSVVANRKKWMTEQMSEESCFRIWTNFFGLFEEKDRTCLRKKEDDKLIRFGKKCRTFSLTEISASEVNSATSESFLPTSSVSTTTATAATGTTTTTSATFRVKTTQTSTRPRIRIGEIATRTSMDFINIRPWSTNSPSGKSSYSKIKSWIHQVKLLPSSLVGRKKARKLKFPFFFFLAVLAKKLLYNWRKELKWLRF